MIELLQIRVYRKALPGEIKCSGCRHAEKSAWLLRCSLACREMVNRTHTCIRAEARPRVKAFEGDR